MEGCKRGAVNCSLGSICDWPNGERSYSFEECERQAQDLNSFSFSYSGDTGRCTICDEFEFITRRNQTIDPTWGIYRNPSKGNRKRSKFI